MLGDAAPGRGFAGPILAVEDEAFLAFDLEDMLRDLGFSEVTVCASYPEAEEALEGTAFRYAVFDLNLDGIISAPLVERARAIGVRVVVASGYEPSTVPLKDTAIPRVTKPYDAETLARALSAATAA